MKAPTRRPSDAKIRAIIKRPDEQYGHVTYISNTLKNLQKTVEGPIETIRFGDSVGIVNEEGKLRGLQRNFIFGTPPFHDMIVGTIVIVGVDEEEGEFIDCPLNFSVWKSMLRKWGNT